MSSKELEISREYFIKNRNGEDITETEEVKKKYQEYTELQKKKRS